MAENCGGLLVAQHDTGNFKRENPVGAEMAAASGTMKLSKPRLTECGQCLLLSGSFLPLRWAGPENKLDWMLELTLYPGKPRLDIKVHINWKGESSRVRLHLPTTVESAHGLYEVPFGVVKRKPYNVRHDAKGAWPVHRFALIEDGTRGVALVNTGSIGAEVSGGSIRATLFRAPEGGDHMVTTDESSSVHGKHEYRFAVVPFTGPFAGSPVLRQAQEVNNPLLVREARDNGIQAGVSLFNLEPDSCVLSAIKAPENGSKNKMVVRFYESTGLKTTAKLKIAGMKNIWLSDLLEKKGEEAACSGETAEIPVKPFEIKTLLIEK
jgi:alpha-mannosidase